MREGEEIHIITNAGDASKKVNETILSAEKEIIILTSSSDVVRVSKNKTLLKNWHEKGVDVRIMAPITNENLKAATALSKSVAIRHMPACHSGITVVDGRHLFQFKAPLTCKAHLGGIQQFAGTLYTDKIEYAQRAKDILNRIWEDAFGLSRVIVGSIARMPVPTVAGSMHVFDIATIMAKQNIGAVIVTRDSEPLGMITERDIIERVVLSGKNPREVVAQEIMTAPILTIHYQRTIEKALEIMHRNRVRRLVVVKGERMVGLLTERRLTLAQASIGPNTKR